MSPRPDAAVLALDQGTTGSTALVFGPEGEVLGRAYAEITQHYPLARLGRARRRGDLAEDPAGGGRGGRRPRGRRARGGPGHRHHQPAGDDGPLGPQDRRPGLPRDRLAEPPDRRRLRAPEGRRATRPSSTSAPASSSTRTSRAARSPGSSSGDPALRARAEAGEIAFGTIDSWLIHRLTGGRVHATDPTNASRTLLFDIHSRRWDPELLRDPRRARRDAARGAPELRRLRRDRGPRRHPRRRPDRRRRRRPAGRALRPGLLRGRDGEEHLRHRGLPGPQHRRPPRHQPARPADDAVLRRPRAAPPTRSRGRSSWPGRRCSGCATSWGS